MERGGDDPEEVDREVDLLERTPLPDHSGSRHYSFKYEAGIDMFEIVDSVSKRFLTSDAICKGVAYVQVWVERKSECSSPSFHSRLQAFVCDWSRRAGWPELLRYDQEMHERGVLSSILIENGVMIRLAGLGIP